MDTHHYHTPVLLDEVLQGLAIQPEGTYVDLTFGGGGHARAILARLGKQGRLLALDQDPAAQEQATLIQDERFTFIPGNFRFLTHYLAALDLDQVDGLFADLGLSSHQLDTPARGFAARLEGPLDMRMGASTLTAAHIVNTYSLEQLTSLLAQYGELRQSRRIAQLLLAARTHTPLTTTAQLCEAVAPALPYQSRNKFYAQLFQALRIVVNDELTALADLLSQVTTLLRPQGRLAIIAYHSLEDRMVKHFTRSGNLKGILHKDVYGNLIRPFEPLSTKVIKATEAEIATNKRARSARLRIAVRCQPPTSIQ